MTNKQAHAYVWGGIAAALVIIIVVIQQLPPSGVEEVSRVKRENTNALLITVRPPINAATVRAFAAYEQGKHALVRIYVQAEGAKDPEALYDLLADGTFERRY